MPEKKLLWSKEVRRAIHDQLITTDDYRNNNADQQVADHLTRCIAVADAKDRPFRARQTQRQGKPCLELEDQHAKICEKVSAKILRTRLGIATRSRHQQVSNLVSCLNEQGPSLLYRADISDFFESLDRNALISRVTSMREVSGPIRSVLLRYDKTCQNFGMSGLCRGLAISSTLSELALQPLDAAFLADSSIYFYARFVDDIVIAQAKDSGCPSADTVLEEKLDAVAGDLALNPLKTLAPIKIHHCGGSTAIEEPFTFLGYNFKPAENSQVSIDIAPKKVDRIKRRVVRIFLNYLSSRNLGDLHHAIRLISSNTLLIRSGINPKAMLVGIYYNYPHLTADNYSDGALGDLDNFLRNLIFGSKSRLSRRIASSLTTRQKRKVARVSFVVGHRDRLFHRMSPYRARRLIEGWSHGN